MLLEESGLSHVRERDRECMINCVRHFLESNIPPEPNPVLLPPNKPVPKLFVALPKPVF